MKELFETIKLFVITNLSKAFKAVRKHSGVAVAITNKIKAIVESPIIDIATDLIPGDLDDKIHEKLKILVPQVALKLAIAHKVLSENAKDSDAVENIVVYLKSLNPEARIGFWVHFTGELNKAMADQEISLSEAIALSQLAYQEFKKK
jgi:hypothetical protein